MAVTRVSFMATAGRRPRTRAISLIGDGLLRHTSRRAQATLDLRTCPWRGEHQDSGPRARRVAADLRHTSNRRTAHHHVEQQYVGLETFGERSASSPVRATRTS